jgi:D-alanyl-D-alanine carboxypeptidase
MGGVSRPRSLVLAVLTVLSVVSASNAAATATPADVQRGLRQLVNAPGGPPGAVATLYRDGRLTVLRAGRADLSQARAPLATDHMRIASITKAFTGAVALNLVRAGKLGLDDTIAQRLPEMPSAWAGVTLRQLLNHTSGLPDYSGTKQFVEQLTNDPHGYVSPSTPISWVRNDPLVFAPGSDYEYSNTDNIVVGLMVEAVTGHSFAQELKRIVFGPAGLRQTSLPSTVAIPSPIFHGYLVSPGEKPEDASTLYNPSGAWASGGIVSTPRDLNAFVRSDLGLKFFSRAQQRQQMRFVLGGESVPPGPGKNSAGLALFRYQTGCGTVYGHSGDFPGYAQWAAASANGKRAVTTSIGISAPTGKLLTQLRKVQAMAVCALLSKP